MIYFYNSMNLILIVTPCVSKNIIHIINLQYVQALYKKYPFLIKAEFIWSKKKTLWNIL